MEDTAKELREALRRICAALGIGDYAGAAILSDKVGKPLLEKTKDLAQ